MEATPPTAALTARGPEDLIAMAPVVLGFQPEESIVMLTFGPGAFHARIDLPHTLAEVDAVASALLTPVLRHGLRRSALLVFSRTTPDRRVVSTLLDRFLDAGVGVVDLLLVDGRQWHHLDEEGDPGAGVPYDVAHHPFAAHAVVSGQVTWSSRGAMAASLEADHERIAEVRPLVEALPVGVPSRQRAGERAWLLATIAAADRGMPPDDETVARLLRDLRVSALWATVLMLQSRECAEAGTALWTSVLRAAPQGWVAGPAALLGFVAWLGGQGALAWCAIERCLAESPRDERAHWLADLLMGAVPPSRWEELRDAVRDPA